MEWVKLNTYKQTHTNKPSTSILCPTCNTPMVQCQYYGGGIYWLCDKCGCKVERTGI